MTQNLKEFLNQKDTQEALASYNFKYIYEQLDKLSNQWEYIPEFTELMLSLGYNPLDYMTMVPPYFLYDSSIKEFTIPNHIKSIDVAAFKGCINLTNITIPDSVTSIGTSAFYGCKNLKTVYYEGTQEQWSKIFTNLQNHELLSANIIFEGGK